MANQFKPTYKRSREPGRQWQRRLEALNMRKLGFSYAEIAEKLGYCSHKSARGAVNVALRAVEVEAAEDYRRVHLARLETMLTKVWPGILDGKPRSVEAGIRILDRAAKLLGLDMPARTEISGGLGLALMEDRMLEGRTIDDYDQILATIEAIKSLSHEELALALQAQTALRRPALPVGRRDSGGDGPDPADQ